MKKFLTGLAKTKKAKQEKVNYETTMNHSLFSGKAKQEQSEDIDLFSNPNMRDLTDVGERKAVGYLPLAKIRDAGYDVFQVSVLLKRKGLKLLTIPNVLPEEIYAYNPEKGKFVHISDNKEYDVIPKGGFLSIQSGALVAYDEEAVNLFLQNNTKIIDDENQSEPIDEHKWPMNADDFVNMLFRKTANSKEMNTLIHQIYQAMPTVTSTLKFE